MRATKFFSLAVLLLTIASSSCASQPWPVPLSDDAGTPSTNDLATTPDLSTSGITVRCGTDTCHPPATACCSGDSGRTGTCLAPDSCPTQYRYNCDRASDCPSQVCCYTTNNGGVCTDDNACKGMMGSQRLCVANTDCDAGEQCCSGIPSPGTPPYKFCVAGVCAI